MSLSRSGPVASLKTASMRLQSAGLCAEVVGLGPGGAFLEAKRVEQGLDVHAVTACGSRQVGAFAPVRRRIMTWGIDP
ncbi:hypothetical protein [Streptomyces sp. CA-132043]|uniref:hypothetical protein n=1 Tax=Streptomyces sp. CA-132043 TaxID=3240048 RepID=UPI003D8F9A51